MKKVLKIVGSVIGVCVLLVAGMLLFLTLTDYNPEDVESLEVVGESSLEALKGDETISVVTWNIGYGALGAEEDFFMDDGTKSRPDSKEAVEGYLANIREDIGLFDTDFVLLQEVDIDAKRSYHVNQLDYMTAEMADYSYTYGKNYDVKYIPIPWPPMGKVEAGLVSYSKYDVDSATRYSLPGQYEWPQKVVMLDRCMVVSRVSLEDKAGDLVMVNAHFSAYDDGTIREQQLEFIKSFVVDEYEQGNYVVLGGDWNQSFYSVQQDLFPLYQNGEYWLPNTIPASWLNEGWTFGIENDVPTYRLLNEPFNEGVTQMGVIDGFLLSPNVELVDVKVIDEAFENSDHNPVYMEFRLLD